MNVEEGLRTIFPMQTALDQFCGQVLADLPLQERLRAPDDVDEFIALVVGIAGERGLTRRPLASLTTSACSGSW